MSFVRGEVYNGNIPEFNFVDGITPEPGYVLKGQHMMIVIHNHDSKIHHSRSVMVIPITSAKAEVQKAQREGRAVRSAYVEIEKADHPFLDHDSFASTEQMIAINREWLLPDKVGTITEEKMMEIDFQMIRTNGLQRAVQNIAEAFYEAKMEAQEAALMAAAGSEEVIKKQKK
ncbi:type II toxin-antitoxin system PemK/MazF family toxin [Priestia sp. BR_2]